MKSKSLKFVPIMFCILIILSCDNPIPEEAPYQLINPGASTRVYGIYPQDDGTYNAIASTDIYSELKSDVAIYRFDRDWNLTEKIGIPTDSLNVVKQCVEADDGYWLTLQCILESNRYRYELMHIDRSGNELYRGEFANTDGMLGVDLFMQEELGTLVVYTPDDIAIHTFTNDGLNEDPWRIERAIDFIVASPDKPGTLLGEVYFIDQLTILELDVAGRKETSSKIITGFDPDLELDDFYPGKKSLVVLRNPYAPGPIPPNNLLYLVDGDRAPTRVPFKGYVVDVLNYKGERLILGAQKTEEKPKLTSLITIHKLMGDGTLELLASFDPKNLMIPQAVIHGDSIVLYGHVGHPVFGLTGFIKEIALINQQDIQ